MDILSFLEQKAVGEQWGKELFAMASRIKEEVTSHQKRVLSLMPEFDLHDDAHLLRVEEAMALFAGEGLLKKLSVIDLFLLFSAAWLHDCGMAPADYEINLMKMADELNRSRFKPTEAKDFVIRNRERIYGEFNTGKGLAAWIFGHKSEASLVDYLAGELCEYQEFRVGYAPRLIAVTPGEDALRLNESIRTDYIRKTHAARSEVYINNMEGLFCEMVGSQWVKGLLRDLGKICKAHGEDLNSVNSLPHCRQYVAGVFANPQFAAMMLRLADIVQFSEARAPMSLRNAKMFVSDYSFRQWAMKEGLNYAIADGTVSYTAFCESPAYYYQLHDYIDWVDEEIMNFQMRKDKWEEVYRIPLKEVHRGNITYDDKVFIPARGKKFRLDQNKILHLLMGTKLYGSPYAGIRELYQNSLDACRCMISRNEAMGKSARGNIEFGIRDDEGGKYLYCLDNGIGMTKSVIENFLLNIGSSYYKSDEFFREMSAWKQDFVPTSQFGIGILSCFMIGKRLEITTKHAMETDPVSCCIEGPTEYFYYKHPNEYDMEKIPDTGTLVKVYLKDEYAGVIDDKPSVMIGLLGKIPASDGEFRVTDKTYEKWKSHLYGHVMNSVIMPFENVRVSVRTSDGSLNEIMKKYRESDFTGLDLDDPVYGEVFGDSLGDIKDMRKHAEYAIDVVERDVHFIVNVFLPVCDVCGEKNFIKEYQLNNICVDGINVPKGYYHHFLDSYSRFIVRTGCLNFTGKYRPSLSVSREEIVEEPQDMKAVSESLVRKAMAEMISVTKRHIETHKLSKDEAYSVWGHVFYKLKDVNVLFINQLASTDIADGIYLESLNELWGKEVSIKDFMNSEELVLRNYDYWKLHPFVGNMVASKMLEADTIEVDDSHTVTIKTSVRASIPVSGDSPELETKFAVRADKDAGVYGDFDMISNIYPLISGNLFEALDEDDEQVRCSDRAVAVTPYADNYLFALSGLDARQVHPEIGLFRSALKLHEQQPEYDFSYKIYNVDLTNLKRCADDADYMIAVYVAPRILSDRDYEQLESRYAAGSDYRRGVHEGWSILVTGMATDNVVILPGRRSREELLQAVPGTFWDEYSSKKFIFPDGRPVKKSL